MNSEKNKTILLVEDEVIIAMNEKMSLEKFGYEVITVNSGLEAIEAVKLTEKIDLVLMDIDLGKGIDGTDAATLILKDHDIPVVFCSNHSEPEIVEKTEKIASYGYVVKNSGIVVLDTSIKMAFRLFSEKLKTEKREQELQSVLDATTDGIWKWNFITNEMFFSDKYYQMLGYSPNEFPATYDAWISLIHPDDIDHAVKTASTYLKNKPDTYENQFRLRTKNDDYRWIKSTARVTQKDSEGKPVLMIGNHEDITEEVLSVKRIAESEKLYKKTFEFASIGIARLYSDGKFIEVNQYLCDMVGYTKDELLSKTFRDITHPDDLYLDEKFITQVIDGEIDTFRIQKRYICKNGDTIWIILHSSVSRDENGDVDYAIAVIEDITGQRQFEDEIKSQNTLLSMIMETSPVGIATVDVEGNITYANCRAEQILGIEKSKITARKYDSPEWSHTDIDGSPFPAEKLPISIVKATGKSVFNIQHGITWPDGKSVMLSINASPLRDKEGHFNGMVATFDDITDKLRAEKTIISQLSEKEILLKEVHHRIKNNIASIEGLLSMQLENSSNPEAVSALQDAIIRVQGMRILYDKLLISKDYKEVSIKAYSEALIDAIAAVFSESGKVTIEKQITDFYLDTKSMFSVGIIINELFTNIFKYAFKGRDCGHISIVLDKTDTHVNLSIQDNGNGIDESVDFNKSPGFGLIIVKMLAEQLGGTFTIENQNGTRSILKFDN